MRGPATRGAELGLAAALRAATDRLASFGGAGISVTVAPLPALPAAVEVAAFRVAMEATTNAVRHAGASSIGVHVSFDEGVALTVEDDGRGIDTFATPGVGLRAMADRAEELNGWLRTGPAAGGGTRVQAWLPISGTIR